MLKTYKAKLQKNSIKWLDDKPANVSKNDSYIVHITIINKESKDIIKKNNLIDFFKNSPLADSELKFDRDLDFGREVNF